MSIVPFLQKVSSVILNPLILLLFSIATLVFLWGVFQFISNTSDPKAREQGGKSIQWGLIGLVIMFAVYGIIRLLLSSVGVEVSGFPF